MAKEVHVGDVWVQSASYEKQKAKHMRLLIDASSDEGVDTVCSDFLLLADGSRVQRMRASWEHEDTGEIFSVIGD